MHSEVARTERTGINNKNNHFVAFGFYFKYFSIIVKTNYVRSKCSLPLKLQEQQQQKDLLQGVKINHL